MIEYTDETYEAIGRAAMGMLQGSKLGDKTTLDEYVMRADVEDRPAVREILENVVVPLCSLASKKKKKKREV